MVSRPNCFQIVVQHFSEEQYIFFFNGETPELAQVMEMLAVCSVSVITPNAVGCFCELQTGQL